MPDFEFGNVDHLKRNLEIEGKTGTELGIDGGITLIVLAASDANPMWKAQRDKVRRTLASLTNARADDRRARDFLSSVYAETLVKDWRGVVDKDGNAIPYTREAGEAFLRQIDDAYAALEAVVYETKNFRGARIEAIVDSGKA